MLRQLLKISFMSTVWPYTSQKLTRWGRIGSWKAIHWWVTEYFDILWLRKCLRCKTLEDEAMQGGCQRAARAGCSLKAGEPGAAGCLGTGRALTNEAPSCRLWPRWAEPVAGNPLHQQLLAQWGDETGPGSSQGISLWVARDAVGNRLGDRAASWVPGPFRRQDWRQAMT